jgi:hypothetical protein
LGCQPPLSDTLLLGTRLTLDRCEEENDGPLQYDAYNYSLSLRTSGRPFRTTLLPTMPWVFKVLQQLFGYSGTLVPYLVVLLARYDGDFVDTLSSASLSDYPARLAAVMHRMSATVREP